MNTSADTHLDGLDLAGELIDENFSGWSPELVEDFKANEYNYQVGSTLLSETDKVKVWYISVPPGGRLGAHRHVLDYFWTALRDGSSVQHTDDGTTRRVSYRAGDTRHFTFGPGQYLLHDLCNDSANDIEFLTVEHLRQPGDNGPRQD